MATRVEIKICGLRTIEDIEKINNLEIQYIGFVFAPSKRQVTPEQAKKLIQRLNPQIKTVGVFVNETMDKVNEIAAFCPLDIVQLHGDETPLYCSKIRKPVWKSLSIGSAGDVARHAHYPDVSGILLDTFIPGVPGGSGKAFSWDLAVFTGGQTPSKIILAGGLSPSNVSLAIKTVGPQVVDVSSGVESDNVKDLDKIKQFIRSVRAYG
ncbi:MAG TPA: phosphoribosylanthranilate isomerase [Epulopiscium sp.]|nr:phosphoribosylanthranilate isomerase [Candidatus Epulonipiscium sp.]